MRDFQKFTGLLVRSAAIILAPLFALSANAAVPGITGPAFDLFAATGFISHPDAQNGYAWDYGCFSAPLGSAPDASHPPQGPNLPTVTLPAPRRRQLVTPE